MNRIRFAFHRLMENYYKRMAESMMPVNEYDFHSIAEWNKVNNKRHVHHVRALELA